MNDELPDDLVDSKEAAKILRLALPVLHRWRARGKVRGWRRGGRWYYSRAELLRMFVPSAPAPSLPPTRGELERRAEAACARLRARGWKVPPPSGASHP
ncbi:MAG TPA: helix-turn-helix domain-containing protein [Gemmataceae bacterium]|nr:helix-turn-helix domain-containing protein [Gemmataceae bacterium]